MKIMILGSQGQLGVELQRLLSFHGDLVALSRTELDLEDESRIREVVRTHRPEIIVNAAAYTHVDRAETERTRAHAINATAPRILAEEAAALRSWLIHFSTDYVFDGQKGSAYVESDITNPLNVYGMTKRDGERAVQAATDRSLILRTSWVYSLRGRNFLLTMRRLAQERDQLQIVNDQFGSPTSAITLAQIASRMISQGLAPGLFHLSDQGVTTWYDFAREIFRLDAEQGLYRPPRVDPISSADFASPVKRPAFSALSSDSIQRALGLRLLSWEQALRDCVSGSMTP